MKEWSSVGLIIVLAFYLFLCAYYPRQVRAAAARVQKAVNEFFGEATNCIETIGSGRQPVLVHDYVPNNFCWVCVLLVPVCSFHAFLNLFSDKFEERHNRFSYQKGATK